MNLKHEIDGPRLTCSRPKLNFLNACLSAKLCREHKGEMWCIKSASGFQLARGRNHPFFGATPQLVGGEREIDIDIDIYIYIYGNARVQM